MNNLTDKQMLVFKLEDEILEIIDNKVFDEVTRGDLQGFLEAKISSYINQAKKLDDNDMLIIK